MDRTDKAFLVLLIIALAAALFLAVGRMRLEAGSRVVEIVVDADDARLVASASGQAFPAFLRELRNAGASALGVKEMTLEELLQAGRVALTPGSQATVVAPDQATAGELAQALQRKFPQGGASVEGASVRLGRLSSQQLWETPLLLPADEVAAARATGLRVVARLGNFPGASPAAIDAAAIQAQRTGASLVIFRGDQVLGYRDLLPATARAFARHHLLYGFVEIAAQKGEETLSRKLASRLVRVHSISDADLETISAQTAIARYARAVRERSIRVRYVRLLTGPQASSLQANLDYVSAVVGQLRETGFRIGPPAPLSAPAGWPSAPARWLTALGVIAGAMLLLRRLLPVSALVRWILALVGCGLLLASALKNDSLLTALAGLMAASAFPALGLAVALREAKDGAVRPSTGAFLSRALAGLGLASLCSLIGGLLIVGLYASVPHLQGIGVFTGVKVGYLVPALVALLVAVAGVSGPDQTMEEWRSQAPPRLAAFLRNPVSWGGALVIVVALAGVALVLMRSGNESAVAPSGFELQMRNSLETILIARPRTKEFLLGHPALMLAIVLTLRDRRTWLPLVALLAAFGQVSLLNTFCHFHIPLYLSLLRSVHGVWIGAIFGVLLILLWRALCDRPARVTV